MSKNRDSTRKSARALKRLEAHNESPKAVVQDDEATEMRRSTIRVNIVETVVIDIRVLRRVIKAWKTRHGVVVVARLAVDTNTVSHVDDKIVARGRTNGVDMNDLEADILVRFPAKASPPRGPGRS